VNGAMPEIGFYTLGGQVDHPRELIAEVQQAESLGIGECFVSERFSTKEAATICGAVAAASQTIGITTAATNHNTRHPIVTAAFATTMHRLTGGRFTLGIGRGIEPLQKAFGMSPVTTAGMEEFADEMRRLFKGETVFGHRDANGTYPAHRLDSTFDEHVELGMVAFGPRSLELAGRAFDAVVLHTFFTDETLVRCVTTVKRAAERAGRDPAEVKVWSCLATVGDHLPAESRLRKTVGRLASYLQGYGDLLVATNGWDPAVLERFRRDTIVRGFLGAGGSITPIDSPSTTVEELEHIAGLLPEEWLAPSATGTPDQCAAAIRRQLALGADGVILHGASPSQLEPILPSYRALREGI
jgi:probable F420-dependent oxidoreductase